MPKNEWDPSFYDHKHAFVFEYGKTLIPVLSPQSGELILDLASVPDLFQGKPVDPTTFSM